MQNLMSQQQKPEVIEAKSLTAAKRIARANGLRRFAFINNNKREVWTNGSSDLRGKWFLNEI